MPAPPRCSRRAIAPLLALWIAATCSPATAAAPADDRAVDTVSRRIAGREVAYAHPPLDEPEVRSIATADHMRSTDIVAGVISGGASRAYPWWVLKNHHAVNDTLGNEAILIAFCEQCSAATGFLRTLGDRVLAMDTEGVVNGTIVLRDRETGTLWAPFDGEGLEGPLVGERLARIPVFLTTWGDWQRRHPATDVLYGRAELREGHGSREHPGQWGVVGEMGETLRSWDTRLAENELVYGTTVGEEARAYPFRTVRERGGIVVDQLGVQPVVVVARGEFEMAAYDRRLGDRRLGFEAADDESTVLTDLETGSRWTIEGVAVGGPLAGNRLTPLDGYAVEWHVWSEYHPGSSIFGGEPGAASGDFPFPLTSLPRLVGESVRVESLDLGAPLNVVVAWARWCPPCRDKIPLLSRLAAGARERGYSFRSIAVQLPNAVELNGLKNFIFEHKIDWPIFLFDEPRYAEFDAYYRKHSGRGLVIPMAFLVDGQGQVRRVLEGAELDEIERVIDALSTR